MEKDQRERGKSWWDRRGMREVESEKKKGKRRLDPFLLYGREEGWKKRAVGRRSARSASAGTSAGRTDVPRRTLHRDTLMQRARKCRPRCPLCVSATTISTRFSNFASPSYFFDRYETDSIVPTVRFNRPPRNR